MARKIDKYFVTSRLKLNSHFFADNQEITKTANTIYFTNSNNERKS